MKVPFFANDLQYKNLREEWNSRVDKVWASGQYFNGKEVRHLEERLASIAQRKYAVALGSCSDALTISTNFYSLSRWAVSPFTFVSSASSAIRANSQIHLTSLNTDSFCPQVPEYAQSVTLQADIEGVVHVDLFGSCQYTRDVEDYCKKNDLVLIEDAAQSFGGHCGPRPSGSFGEASCLSFDPTKLISGTSAAGALLTDDYELSEFAKSMRLHGKDAHGSFSQIGMKSLMSSVEAAIIDLKLNYLEDWVEKRNEIADLYSEQLKHDSIVAPQKGLEHKHSFHKYVIKVPSTSRFYLREYLSQKGIETRVHYPRDLSQEPAIQSNSFTADASLELHNNCDEVLSLPIYPELTKDQIKHVTESIHGFFDDF